MKNKILPYFVLFFVNISIVFSCFFYPLIRDEFYYLSQVNLNVFQEYVNAYFTGNPRIGQFFCNLIGRNKIFELIFGFVLFNTFFNVLFLLIFREKFDFRNILDIKKILALVAFFIININYFGEMFYYNPFSSNYTFSTIFYLFYLYLFIEYLVFENNVFSKKNFILFILLGIFTGMCNEHVPPVLLLMGFLGGIYFIFQNKKLPDFKFIMYNISVFIGYLILFFAPANTIKYKTLGKTQYGFSLENYLNGFKQIFKIYYYYNSVLILFFLVALVLFFYLFKKKFYTTKVFISKVVLLVGLITLPIVAYSPLIGTRLLFFCNALLIIFSFSVFLDFFKNYKSLKSTVVYIVYFFLILFFMSSDIITFNANENYKKIEKEISNKALQNKDVFLEKSFNYETSFLGRINRMILLETGKDYIDNRPDKDNATEKLLKSHFKINKISTQ